MQIYSESYIAHYACTSYVAIATLLRIANIDSYMAIKASVNCMLCSLAIYGSATPD